MLDEQDRLTMLSLDVTIENQVHAKEANEKYFIMDEFFSRSLAPVKNKRVVIVGGGIVGLMSAYFLQKVGYDLTVVERKTFGAAASGRNGGGVLAIGRELSEIPFARLSIDFWEQLEKDGIPTHFSRTGHLMLARNKHEKDKLERAAELYRLSGLKVDWLNANELGLLAPDLTAAVEGGYFSEIDAQSYPFTTINGLLKVLKERGARLINFTSVIGFETSGGMIKQVSTDKGPIDGDIFLISAGPWSTEVCNLLNEDVPITPRRSQIMATEILKRNNIVPFVSGNGLYLKQSHAGNVLFGGGGAWEKNGYDTANSQEAIEKHAARLIELFPGYRNKQLIRAFAGTVEITPDHIPFFGPLGMWNNGFISAGYNGHGYGMSAFMGKFFAYYLTDLLNATDLGSDIESILRKFAVNRFYKDEGGMTNREEQRSNHLPL